MSSASHVLHLIHSISSVATRSLVDCRRRRNKSPPSGQKVEIIPWTIDWFDQQQEFINLTENIFLLSKKHFFEVVLKTARINPIGRRFSSVNCAPKFAAAHILGLIRFLQKETCWPEINSYNLYIYIYIQKTASVV